MRTREEIEKILRSGVGLTWQERTILELLLDIRDLLVQPPPPEFVFGDPTNK